MRKIKYIISFFVILLALLFNGESFQFYLNNMEAQYYNTSLYLQDYQEPKEMIADIINSGAKHNVMVFTIIENVKNAYLTEKTFFCDEKSKSHIKNGNKLEEKKYISVFSGVTDIKFKQLENLENVANVATVNEYYLIGDPDDIHQFKMDLIDKYAGNHPKEGYKDNTAFLASLFLWIVAGIIILILSFYDIIYQKKENFIKISLGESVNLLIIKNIVFDILAYCIMFIFSVFILQFYTSVLFNIKSSICIFLIIVIINSFFYLYLKFYDIKKILSNTVISKKLLFVNYILKVITCISTIIIVSGNIMIIYNSLEFYTQKDFFEKYDKYSYIHLDYKLRLNEDGTITDHINDSTIIREQFYRKYFDKFNATLSAQLDFDNTMIANKNSLEYLKENINDLNNKEFNKEIYFIIPHKYRKNTELIDELKNWVTSFEGKYFSFDFDVIYYKDNAKLIAINEQNFNGSCYLKNPVIIYNNINASLADYKIDTEWFKNTYEYDIMYALSESELQSFINENNLEGEIHSTTNVYENYIYHWTILKRSMCISIALSLLILCLEFIVIKYIIKLEYEANAIELSLKKILGYGLWEKNCKILILTLTASIVSIIFSCIIGIIFKISEAKFILIGGLLIAILEIVIIFKNINKLEKTNIQKILKGGSL